jgi:hypothetical protein
MRKLAKVRELEIGAEWIAESARPSTVLDCRGSITPSSQRRPVA